MSNNRIYYSREAELQARRERTVVTILFLSLGLGIGAVLALLFAPSSGREIREEIAQTIEDRFEDGREATASTIERLEREFNDLRNRVEENVR